MYYAHTVNGRPEKDWEPLREHLECTAQLAKQFASTFGAGAWGELAGLWHDLGKYSEAFQAYLRASAGGDGGVHRAEVAGKVDHSTAGAQRAASLGPLGRLLAYCIAGHHAGLPDNEGEASSLRSRLEKSIASIGAAPPELLGLPLPSLWGLRCVGNNHRRAFTLAFATRMLFSCLVDADYLATEKFLAPERSRKREGGASCEAILDRLNRHLDELQREKQRRGGDTPVNRRRREVLDACRAKAALEPGFFSLDVPTGGGKTLSSLAFALEHAKKHQLRRVVYAIPFTSIIEQTANVFREALGDLADEVLEHHSSLDPDDPNVQSDRSRLAAENFDATLIVTTNVQLFESLFACRPSRCRKLHRLAQSVIILDEAQTLPPRLLAPTLTALDELVTNYGATVLLCTATQPAIEHRKDFPIGIANVRPIIDDPAQLHRALRRTTVEILGQQTDEDLAGRLRQETQVLCIVNSRRHAAALFETLGDPDALHLSASMCAEHRGQVIEEMRRRLRAGPGVPCRVVSTQVIEAGVDVDFPVVYRAAAGLDSIAQAAGRCNREGLLRDKDGRPRPGRVVVFDDDAEAYPTVPLIAKAAGHYREVAPEHRDDLLSPRAIEAYFNLHYWQQGGDGGRGWDRGAEDHSVLDCFAPDPKNLLHAQFRSAASAYRLIDDGQFPVIVPFDSAGRLLIEQLEAMPDPPDPKLLRDFDRKAQRFVVSVFERELRTLLQNGVLLERLDRFYLANSKAYDERLGLCDKAIGLDESYYIL
ncbi:CRISPR-associated helicase Cas3' [Tautonia sociabilis]|uniref:CRISPR-associated helicase Cas3 n=1 Tax=Tautonia sociabilis TaxID=2080755 RepID=A0A432ME65_9BACT|nr:CRISPR-associated helicase Cas3' [Tautonia sociabilis]RUL83506.1 CRISPR-associated helicase Cas3' [Tautonia sociabilis]